MTSACRSPWHAALSSERIVDLLAVHSIEIPSRLNHPLFGVLALLVNGMCSAPLIQSLGATSPEGLCGVESVAEPTYHAARLDRSLLPTEANPNGTIFSLIYSVWDSLCGSR